MEVIEAALAELEAKSKELLAAYNEIGVTPWETDDSNLNIWYHTSQQEALDATAAKLAGATNGPILTEVRDWLNDFQSLVLEAAENDKSVSASERVEITANIHRAYSGSPGQMLDTDSLLNDLTDIVLTDFVEHRRRIEADARRQNHPRSREDDWADWQADAVQEAIGRTGVVIDEDTYDELSEPRGDGPACAC